MLAKHAPLTGTEPVGALRAEAFLFALARPLPVLRVIPAIHEKLLDLYERPQ